MATDLFKIVGENNGAQISECGLYRYHLWRIWDDERPILVFVMLNPSTADATQDDPTIRRCIGFAKRGCFGGISVRNVFAFRATNPAALLQCADPIGPDNDLLAARNVSLMTRLVVAWGARFGGKRLSTGYKRACCACSVQQAYCLGTTKRGDPRHPLFLRGDAEMVKWTSPGY